MEAKPPETNLSSIQPLVGDEPSRTVDVEHAPESGQAADTHEPNLFRPESVAIHPDHAKAIYEAVQYYALLYGTQIPAASADRTLIMVVEMLVSSVLHISNSKRSCA